MKNKSIFGKSVAVVLVALILLGLHYVAGLIIGLGCVSIPYNICVMASILWSITRWFEIIGAGVLIVLMAWKGTEPKIMATMFGLYAGISLLLTISLVVLVSVQ